MLTGMETLKAMGVETAVAGRTCSSMSERVHRSRSVERHD
jgi:hypothetical protein